MKVAEDESIVVVSVLQNSKSRNALIVLHGLSLFNIVLADLCMTGIDTEVGKFVRNSPQYNRLALG